MTTTEWLTDIALLLIVFRQLREGRVDVRFVLLPLGIVTFVAHSYLHGMRRPACAGAGRGRLGSAVGARVGLPDGLPALQRERGRGRVRHRGRPVATVAPPADLTAREREVLTLIGQGLSNRAIAVHLFVSEATVKTHINNLFAKADIRDRADAVRRAIAYGLI
jgi:DNA-binding CsgD family transcriptional regulator